jgi:hypothetical protein
VWLYTTEREEQEPDDPLFITRDGDAMNRHSIRQQLSLIGRCAGVKHVHPHRFRHAFTIQYLQNTGDVLTLTDCWGICHWQWSTAIWESPRSIWQTLNVGLVLRITGLSDKSSALRCPLPNPKG